MKNNDQQLKIVQERTENMETIITELQVTNDIELAKASDIIAQIKNLQKFIEREKEKFISPAKLIIAQAKEKYDPYLKKCENAINLLKERAKKYILAQERKRKEAEEKIANKVESGYIKPETAIKKLNALPEEKKTVRTDQGSILRISKRKVAVITNRDLIPREFWIIDEVRVKREALERDKKGEPQIPGVTIQEETDLASL